MRKYRLGLTALVAVVVLSWPMRAGADVADHRFAQVMAWEVLAEVGQTEVVESPAERAAIELPPAEAAEAYVKYATSTDRPEETRGTYEPVRQMLRHRVEQVVGDAGGTEDTALAVWVLTDSARGYLTLSLRPLEGEEGEQSVSDLHEAMTVFVEASLPELREWGLRPDVLRSALAETVVAAVATHLLEGKEHGM